MLCNTHRKQRSKLLVLSGPNCCRFVGVVGRASAFLLAEDDPLLSLIITDWRISIFLQSQGSAYIQFPHLAFKKIIAPG